MGSLLSAVNLSAVILSAVIFPRKGKMSASEDTSFQQASFWRDPMPDLDFPIEHEDEGEKVTKADDKIELSNATDEKDKKKEVSEDDGVLDFNQASFWRNPVAEIGALELDSL